MLADIASPVSTAREVAKAPAQRPEDIGSVLTAGVGKTGAGIGEALGAFGTGDVVGALGASTDTVVGLIGTLGTATQASIGAIGSATGDLLKTPLFNTSSQEKKDGPEDVDKDVDTEDSNEFGNRLVLSVAPLSVGPPSLFELHVSQTTAKTLQADALVRLRHIDSGGWVSTRKVSPKAVEGAEGVERGDVTPTAAGGNQPAVRCVVSSECYVRDGLIIERPTAVTNTFLAVAGVTHHLVAHAAELTAGRLTGAEARPFTIKCLQYLISYLKVDEQEAGHGGRVSTSFLQEVMRELGVLQALVTLLTVPFERLGTVAFHKLDTDKPLLPQSKVAAKLLYHCIAGNALSCTQINHAIPRLEPAARKGIGIGEVLQEVFAEVPVETAQIDFWLHLLAKARRGAGSEADYTGGAMILSLLHAFCYRLAQPVISNQNLIALKLILAPGSTLLDEVQFLEPGRFGLNPKTFSKDAEPTLVRRGDHIDQRLLAPAASRSGRSTRRSSTGAVMAASGAVVTEASLADFGADVIGGLARGGRGLAKGGKALLKISEKASIKGGERLRRMSSDINSVSALSPTSSGEPAGAATTTRVDGVTMAGGVDAAGKQAAAPTASSDSQRFAKKFAHLKSDTPCSALASGPVSAPAQGTDQPDATQDPEVKKTSAFDEWTALRETLAPLPPPPADPSAWEGEEANSEVLRFRVLQEPALLCVVKRRRVLTAKGHAQEQLCLSPFDRSAVKARDSADQFGGWTPLSDLQGARNVELLEYYLNELRLLGGLVQGHNGLTVQTVRALYPFALCMEIIREKSVACQVRAAVCILVRQLYVEAATRELRPYNQSVWDWDALLDCADGSALPPPEACLSRPPPLTDEMGEAEEGNLPAAQAKEAKATQDAKAVLPESPSGEFSGVKEVHNEVLAVAESVPEVVSSPPVKGLASLAGLLGGLRKKNAEAKRPSEETKRIDDTPLPAAQQLATEVSKYIERESQNTMINKMEMQFLGGMLDLAVHLLRYGQLNDLGLISRMFESAVNALAVPVERPLVLRPSAVVPRVAQLGPPERVSAHQSDHLLLREPKPLGDGGNRREVALRVGEAAPVRRRTVRVVHPTRAEADRHVAAGSPWHRHERCGAAGKCPKIRTAERCCFGCSLRRCVDGGVAHGSADIDDIDKEGWHHRVRRTCARY
jgi:hypothetical protein